MNYIEKEHAIITQLKATNYELFDGKEDEALDFIGNTLSAFPHFANTIIKQQIMTSIYYNQYEGQDLRNYIQDMDRRRRLAYEPAIRSIIVLNRISAKLGLEPFANIDTTDRHAVEKFVDQYVNEICNQGINGFETPEHDTEKHEKENPDLDTSGTEMELQ